MSQIFSIHRPQSSAIRAMADPGAPAPEPPTGGDNPGVFVSAKTLATFGVALSSAKIIATVLTQWNRNQTLSDISATAFMSALIFLITMTDPEARPTTNLGWITVVGVAIVNSFILFAALNGLKTV